MPKQPTVEELEDFWERLQGPMGDLLRAAGVIIARRMAQRGVEWSDLSDVEVIDLLHAALLQAGSERYPGIDLSAVEAELSTAFADAKLQIAGNAEGNDARN